MFRVEIYGAEGCVYCERAKALFSRMEIPYIYYDLRNDKWHMDDFKRRTDNATTVPQIFIDNVLIGGYDQAKTMAQDGSLQQQFSKGKRK